MLNINLCVLGQLFGEDTELAIAKEMYPEEYKQQTPSSGYGVGMRMFESWAACGRLPSNEVSFLLRACASYDTKCYWAQEVAERLAQDELQKEEVA